MSERDLQRALADIADRLGRHLSGAAVNRSDLEDALSAHAQPGLRSRLMRLLCEARINVVEDLPGFMEPATDESLGASEAWSDRRAMPHNDPREAGRRRLAMDRLVNPHRLPKILLTADEEVGLALLARPDARELDSGGLRELDGEAKEAADALVLHNLGLAHSVAQKYVGQGLEYEDLFQSAVRGLLRAVEKFNPNSGYKFSTYAMWWLRQAVSRAIADEGRLVRLPVHMFEQVRKVVTARERLTLDGRPPSIQVLADECGIPPETVVDCLKLAPGAISLEVPLGDDQYTLGDLVAAQSDGPEDVEVNGLFPEDVEPLLDVLTQREADVLRMRFGLAPYENQCTLEDIGRVYGITRERIRQIEAKALARLEVIASDLSAERRLAS
jgi:RNA polymerase primary sigma factor